jgi:hypothetical protein
MKPHGWYLQKRKATVSVLEAQTQNVDFVESVFICRTEFVFCRHSTNHGPPSTSRFHLKVKADKVSLHDKVLKLVEVLCYKLEGHGIDSQ